MEAKLTSLERLEEEAVSMGIILDYDVLQPDDKVDGLYYDMGKGRPKIIALNRYRSYSRQTAALA